MATFYSDDELSTYSSITIPDGTGVKCHAASDGSRVEVSFGVHERVTLDVHPDVLDPLIQRLIHARKVQRANSEREQAEAEVELAAYVAAHHVGLA